MARQGLASSFASGTAREEVLVRPSPIAPTHSPVDGHVVGLHVLAVVKSAARNRGGYGSPSKNVCPDIHIIGVSDEKRERRRQKKYSKRQ